MAEALSSRLSTACFLQPASSRASSSRSQRAQAKPCCQAPRGSEWARFPARRSRGDAHALRAASLDSAEAASSSSGEPEKPFEPELACPICYRPFVGRGGKTGCALFAPLDVLKGLYTSPRGTRVRASAHAAPAHLPAVTQCCYRRPMA